MQSIRLSATDLDGWMWYNRMESMETSEFISRLKREGKTNERMLMGVAWHSLLENPPPTIELVEKNGFVFRVECEGELCKPQVSEVKTTKTYLVNGISVTLVGKCDTIDGNVVGDYKLTFRPNPESYFDAYQWKAYLSIYNADKFLYHVFSAKPGKAENEVIIKDFSTMSLYRYPEMEDDLIIGMSELLEFITENCPELIVES